MAQRVKGTYRGRTYSRASKRPGKRTVKVRGYCRRGRQSFDQRLSAAAAKAKEWGF
jgi:hypothetical protein